MTVTLYRPVTDDLTRRRLFTGGAALAMLTGCAATPAPAQPVDAGYPRTVVHAGGTVRLNARPTRVYPARPFADLDALLALGVAPALVGLAAGFDELRSWQGAAAGLPVMDTIDGPNLEQLLAAGVDLVVTTEGLYENATEEIAQLRQVAPVIALPTLDLPGQVRVLTEALGLDPAVGQRVLDDADAAIAAFRPPSVPPRIASCLSYDGTTVRLKSPDSVFSRLLQRLGLPALTGPTPADGADSVEYALETLGAALAGVDLLVGVSGPQLDAIESTPVFRAIDVVRRGAYVRATPAEAVVALDAPSLLNLPVAIEILGRVLAR